MSSTQQLEADLTKFCRSDSLSEDDLQEIIERHGVTPNNNITNFNYEFFRWACYNERVTEGILRYLLEYFPNAVKYADGERGQLPLHYILGRNKNITLGMVELLVDAYPDSLRHETNKGFTPLHFLCQNKDLLDDEGGLKILELIIKRCPESLRHTTREGGIVPIHFAARYQSPEFCRILIEAFPGSERIAIDNHLGVLPFHFACRYNTVATAEYLYKLFPESINVANRNGAQPIHHAIIGLKRRSNPKDGIEVVKFLLGCNPDALSSTGETPLHVICGNKYVTLSVVQLLIDAFPESLRHQDSNGLMPLHKLCENNNLDEAIGLEILKLLLERYPESVRHATRIGNLPIHPAAALQSPEFCRILIEAHPGSERMTNDNGHLPFHAACQCNTVATAKYLHHLYPESINVAAKGGRYPIHFAIVGLKDRSIPKEGIEVLRLLLDCNPDAINSTGQTPLHIACGIKIVTLNIVQLLIDAAPDSVRHEDINGCMPLHALCHNKNLDEDVGLEILKLLIDRCPESVRHVIRGGNLPLHPAAAKQSPEFCRMLVEAYPGSERIANDNDGTLPFHFACQCNTVATAKYLYELYPESINVADKNGAQPIHHAIMRLKDRSNPKDGIEVVRFLLDCNPDAIISTGQTPLHIACCNKNITLPMVELLVDAFPDSLSHETNKGSMPLHFFCRNKDLLDDEGGLKILKLLIKRCTESVRHATTENGNLPIHYAAPWQSPEFCRKLIEAFPGSERITGNNGLLPFHFACQCKTVATAKYLYQLYPESINMADDNGGSPIHYAILGLENRSIPKDGIDVVRFLLGCNPDALSSTGQIPLDIACINKHVTLNIVRALIDAFRV